MSSSSPSPSPSASPSDSPLLPCCSLCPFPPEFLPKWFPYSECIKDILHFIEFSPNTLPSVSVSPDIPPSLPLLTSLLRAFITKVPFSNAPFNLREFKRLEGQTENDTKQTEKSQKTLPPVIYLDFPSLYSKLILNGCGGCCYELHGIFISLLHGFNEMHNAIILPNYINKNRKTPNAPTLWANHSSHVFTSVALNMKDNQNKYKVYVIEIGVGSIDIPLELLTMEKVGNEWTGYLCLSPQLSSDGLCYQFKVNAPFIELWVGVGGVGAVGEGGEIPHRTWTARNCFLLGNTFGRAVTQFSPDTESASPWRHKHLAAPMKTPKWTIPSPEVFPFGHLRGTRATLYPDTKIQSGPMLFLPIGERDSQGVLLVKGIRSLLCQSFQENIRDGITGSIVNKRDLRVGEMSSTELKDFLWSELRVKNLVEPKPFGFTDGETQENCDSLSLESFVKFRWVPSERFDPLRNTDDDEDMVKNMIPAEENISNGWKERIRLWAEDSTLREWFSEQRKSTSERK